MSASGTQRTSVSALQMSAFGGEADMTRTRSNVVAELMKGTGELEHVASRV